MENRAVMTGLLDKNYVLINKAHNSSDLLSSNVPILLLLDRLLFLLKPVVEYAFGTYIGYVLGWIAGFWTGLTYIKYYEPVFIETIKELSKWRLTPYEFAQNGAVIGVVAGIIAIKITNSILLSRKIASLYKNIVNEPEDIAHLLGRSVRQINRRINKLAKRGKIDCKTTYLPKRLTKLATQ